MLHRPLGRVVRIRGGVRLLAVVVGAKVVTVVLLIVEEQFSGKDRLHLGSDHLPGALWIWIFISKTEHYLESWWMTTVVDVLLKFHQKLLGVKQFTRLLLLQLVGLIHVRSKRPFPVNPALAQSLGVHPVRRHPQQHPSLQHIREHVRPLPVGLREGEGEQDDLRANGEPVVGTRGGRGRRGGRGGDATPFRARGGDFFNQRLAVEQ